MLGLPQAHAALAGGGRSASAAAPAPRIRPGHAASCPIEPSPNAWEFNWGALHRGAARAHLASRTSRAAAAAMTCAAQAEVTACGRPQPSFSPTIALPASSHSSMAGAVCSAASGVAARPQRPLAARPRRACRVAAGPADVSRPGRSARLAAAGGCVGWGPGEPWCASPGCLRLQRQCLHATRCAFPAWLLLPQPRRRSPPVPPAPPPPPTLAPLPSLCSSPVEPAAVEAQRGPLATAAAWALAATLVAAPVSAAEEASALGDVAPVYFGNGCFWGAQLGWQFLLGCGLPGQLRVLRPALPCSAPGLQGGTLRARMAGAAGAAGSQLAARLLINLLPGRQYDFAATEKKLGRDAGRCGGAAALGGCARPRYSASPATRQRPPAAS